MTEKQKRGGGLTVNRTQVTGVRIPCTNQLYDKTQQDPGPHSETWIISGYGRGFC